MKLPEWKPLPPHLKNSDDDSKDFGAALALIIPLALIFGGIALFLVGLAALL